MIVLIHDLRKEQAERLLSQYESEPTVVDNDGTIKHCIGCFGCWTKEPGICILQDKYRDNGALMGSAKEIHIVSQCVYGGFSPFVKNVLDRSISYVHPDFRIREGKTHHRLRYSIPFKLRILFYGKSIPEQERITAEKVVKANVINMGCTLDDVAFTTDIDQWIGGSVNAHSND